MALFRRVLVSLAAVAAIALSACVQLPTEKQEVVDLRPQLSFAVPDYFDATRHHVLVDSLDMGVLANYLAGQGALRVLPGMHVVRVEVGGKTVLQETVYLGDGAVRTFQVLQ